MFDVLVESNGEKGRGAKQSAYLGTTALVLGSLFLGVFIYSLFNTDLGYMSKDDMSLDTLVAPVMAEEAPPPPPAPENKPQKQAQADAPKNVDFRTEIIQSMNEAPKVPDTIQNTKSNIPARREGVTTVLSSRNTDAAGGASGPDRSSSGTGQAVIAKPAAVIKDVDDAPPAPKPVEKPKPTTISGGVINGKATRLVQPPYPPAAKAVHASGTVNVQVLIDENGNVVSASATSGNPLLRAAAVQAARASKFSPTQLSGQPVKVSGVIVYNFVAQ
ncbi:MAG: TonB family protein [Pyrinomonadaceae bacterium]